MTTVYVLFHSDIEDDKYVRGVYERREVAEADVPKSERRYSDMPDYQRDHSDACCGVDEMEILAHPVGLEPLPPRPITDADAFIPRSFQEQLLYMLTSKSPYQ